MGPYAEFVDEENMGESMDEFDDDPNFGKQEEKDDDKFKSNLRYAPTLKEGGRSKDR